MSGRLLGIDAGGTRTRALVLNQGAATISRGEAGPVNPSAMPLHDCWTALTRVSEEIVLGSYLRAEEIDAVAICCAGFDPGIHAEAMEGWARRQWVRAKVFVGKDMLAAQSGAFAGGPGMVVVAGTGSVVYGRDESGKEARAGGRGDYFSDAGSGHWVGKEALQAVGEAADGSGTATALTVALAASCPEWGSTGEEWFRGLIAAGPDRTEIAGLARVVVDCAVGGDAVARRILRAAARELGSMTEAVMTRLGGHLPIAVTGGMFQPPSPLRGYLRAWLRRRGLQSPVESPKLEPVEGAVLLAARLLGSGVERDALALLLARDDGRSA